MAAKYHCNYCDENINNVRIRCSECTDFDLCLKCFSSGAEIGSHRKRHSYHLIDCGTFEIFTSTDGENKKWKASSELSLLEAVELYGFGNWSDISEYLTTHSPDDIEKHFLTYFVYGNIGHLAWSTVKDNAIDVIDNTCDNEEEENTFDEDAEKDSSCKLSSNETQIEEHQMLGYMQKRDDYEREYENEAESLVSYLSVQNNDEDSIDMDLKLTSIEIFNRRLRERLRRKRIVCDYKLIETFFKTNAHQNSSQSPNHQQSSPLSVTSLPSSNNATLLKQNVQTSLSIHSSNYIFNAHRKDTLANDFKIFSQFISYNDSSKLISNLKKETELKARIKDLNRYRRNGITRLIECNHFESGRFKRDKRKENKSKKKSICLGEYGRKYWLRSETSKDNPLKSATEHSAKNKANVGRLKKISNLFESRILHSEKQQRHADQQQQHSKRNKLKRLKCLGLGPFRSRRPRRLPSRIR